MIINNVVSFAAVIKAVTQRFSGREALRDDPDRQWYFIIFQSWTFDTGLYPGAFSHSSQRQPSGYKMIEIFEVTLENDSGV